MSITAVSERRLTIRSTTRHHEIALPILESLAAGVLVARTDGTVVYSNTQASRILRQPSQQLEDKPLHQVLAPLDVLLLRPEHDGRREIVLRLGNGSAVALGFTITVLQNGARGDHWVILFQEISAVLELRSQRDRLVQMAALGDAMPTLLHELRNPLAAVTASLELLIEEAPAHLSDDLYAVLSEVRRMNLGLQGIGSLARTAHSSINSAIDLAVREACRLLEPTAERRSVTLRAVGGDLPLLPLDRSSVAGLVFNLVKNALDACPEGGNVLVDARCEDRNTFALEVADDGVGMTPGVLGRCTELFFTTKDTGSGIGLALCRQVAEASGGSLVVSSRPGEGTRVVVRIPLGPAPR